MTSLTLVRHIRARPAVVFQALTSAEGIAHWWGPDAGPVLFAESDARVGGSFRVRFRMLDGTEHESTGQYLELIAPERVVMSWHWTVGGDPDERGEVSRVVIELAPADAGTELTFTHERLKTEAARSSHERGWAGALHKLEGYLSTGT